MVLIMLGGALETLPNQRRCRKSEQRKKQIYKLKASMTLSLTLAAALSVSVIVAADNWDLLPDLEAPGSGWTSVYQDDDGEVFVRS
jgi:hypothetical protein